MYVGMQGAVWSRLLSNCVWKTHCRGQTLYWEQRRGELAFSYVWISGVSDWAEAGVNQPYYFGHGLLEWAGPD